MNSPLVVIRNLDRVTTTFDVKHMLINGDIETYNTPSGFHPEKGIYKHKKSIQLAREIWNIPGVTEIVVSRYAISVTVGRAFSQNLLHSPVKSIISRYIIEKEKLEAQAKAEAFEVISKNVLKLQK